MKTDEEIRDIAYISATSHHLTEDFTFEEFQKVNVMDYASEPFEDWMASMLETQIVNIAESILTIIKKVRDDCGRA